jgi:hypothetical protein
MTNETTQPSAHHPYRSAFEPTLDSDKLRVPYSGQPRMRLAFASGMAHGRIVIDPAAQDLIAVQCGDDLHPRLRVAAGEIALSFHMSFGDWLRGTVRPANRDVAIVLHPAVEWTLAIRDGVASSELDLSAGTIARIDINGGCSNVRFELPLAKAVVPIRIGGGASQLVVKRPGEIGVALAVSGGVASLELDDQRFDAIGGACRLESRTTAGAARYDLQIHGGASHLTIE